MKREHPDQPVLAVGVAVRHGDTVLVVRRATEPARGVWTVPGGVVELGETLVDAARREIREECGLDIEVGPLLHVAERLERDEAGGIRYHYVVLDFLGDCLESTLALSDELMDACWLDRDGLDSVPLSDSARYVLDAALAPSTLGPIRATGWDGDRVSTP